MAPPRQDIRLPCRRDVLTLERLEEPRQIVLLRFDRFSDNWMFIQCIGAPRWLLACGNVMVAN